MSRITECIAALTPEERERCKDRIQEFLKIDQDCQEVFAALAAGCASRCGRFDRRTQ